MPSPEADTLFWLKPHLLSRGLAGLVVGVNADRGAAERRGHGEDVGRPEEGARRWRSGCRDGGGGRHRAAGQGGGGNGAVSARHAGRTSCELARNCRIAAGPPTSAADAPRRLLVAPGMLAAAAGPGWLARIGVHSSDAGRGLGPPL